jgi:tetratricopeptide (TPR) repeat protein
MNTILRHACIALLLSLTGTAIAQKSTLKEEISRADRQFGLYAYQEALQNYQLVLKKEPSNTRALAGSGHCYFRMNSPEKAVLWYEKAVKQSDVSPETYLSYGKALMQTGDYDLAKEQFLSYADENEAVGQHFADMCDFALESSDSNSPWTARNETVNTTGDEFLPSLQGNKLMFVSFNPEFASTSKSNGRGNQNWLLSAQVSSQTGQLQKLQALRSELQNTPNEGPVSYSADGSRVVFCRNNFVNGVRITDDANASMSLYTADVDASGKWKNIKPFTHNSVKYSTGFPSLSPDGKMLFFASDNKDGYGGWDLYVSVFRDGTWGNPRNLGESVNTAGNEISPFYNGDELYFSSDWHPGLGGLDVFSFDYADKNNAEVVNMGPVVNSSSDDFGFVLDKNQKTGYVSSNRGKGKGSTDIWKLSARVSGGSVAAKGSASGNSLTTTKGGGTSPAPKTLKVTVLDEDGKPIPKAEVDLGDCSEQMGMTDASGVFKFEELDKPVNCNIVIRKIGYRDAEIEQKKFGKTSVVINVALERDARESYTGRIIDAATRKALSGVTVTVDFGDEENGFETESDEGGQYTLMVEPGETYVVNYSKPGYVSTIERILFNEDDFELDRLSLEPDSDPAEEEDVDVSDSDKTSNSPFIKLVPAKQRSKTVAIDQISGYSIQISATPDEPSQSRISSYESFSADGNLYVRKEKNLHKLRLGVFKTRPEADAVLKKIVARKGNEKAFIVAERGAGSDLIVKKATQNATGTGTTASYYVLQIATYNDVSDIKAREYEDLRNLNANLFSYNKDGEIFLYLGVWPSQEDAKKARAEVLKLDYEEVTVVKVDANDPDIQEFILAGVNEKSGGAGPGTGYKAPDVSRPYLVRVASVANPDRFDTGELEEYGQIETRPSSNSPGKTLILVGRFASTVEAARVRNRIMAETRYKDAIVIKDTSTD